VFNKILQNTLRICEATFGVLFRFNNDFVEAAAMLGVPPAFAELLQLGHLSQTREAASRGKPPSSVMKLAPPHSITSARSKKDSGIVKPSALAAVRLMTSSNLAGCSTGISAGFVPRKILSTILAARPNSSGKFGAKDSWMRPPQVRSHEIT
jgi:hypothetical protein